MIFTSQADPQPGFSLRLRAGLPDVQNEVTSRPLFVLKFMNKLIIQVYSHPLPLFLPGNEGECSGHGVQISSSTLMREGK